VAVAYWLPSYVVTLAAGPVGLRLEPDGLVLAYSLALALLACLAFGLAPALHATRTDTSRSLGGGDRLTLRGALLAAQVAISVVLLVTAGLMARGIQRARSQDPGFAIKDVSVISFDLPASSYNGPRKHAFFTQLAREVEGVSEARQFGFASNTPLSNRRQVTSFRKDGESASQQTMVTFLSVSAGYFDVLRIPIVAGRNFEAADQDRKVILINETAARRYWPGESPVGRTVHLRTPCEIVGVVKDAYTSDLGQIEPMLYQPIDGAEVPRFAGPTTFARLPTLDSVGKAEVAILGIPFDSGVVYRPGARFGPRAIRAASSNNAWNRPYGAEFDPLMDRVLRIEGRGREAGIDVELQHLALDRGLAAHRRPDRGRRLPRRVLTPAQEEGVNQEESKTGRRLLKRLPVFPLLPVISHFTPAGKPVPPSASS